MKMKKKTVAAISLGLAVFMSANVIADVAQPIQAQASTSSSQEFFTKMGPLASQVAAEKDLFASVMLAQAALESRFGQSGLASSPVNNLFGIKGSYKGKAVSLSTQEDDGSGNMYTIKANFRAYPSARESMYDYANLLNNGRYYNARKSVAQSYQNATASLQGVYATDTQYASKLNHIIESYGLQKYDQGVIEGGYQGDGSETDGGMYEITDVSAENSDSLDTGVYTLPGSAEEDTIKHKIVKGDTLNEIAEQYKTKVEFIKQDNNLVTDLIYVGNELSIRLPTEEIYKIKKGDTLNKIAEERYTTVEHLKELNNLYSDLIHTGSDLLVPILD